LKDIKGYEGLYAVTSCGKVWSYKSNKFLSPYDNGKGYLQVTLYKDGLVKRARVNRLIAEAYIENPDPEHYDQVGHKDEVRNHNWVGNLYWTNAQENNNYGSRNEKVSKALSKAVYCEETGEVYKSQQAAAAALGLNFRSISLCCHGKQKTTGGYHFRFATEGEKAVAAMDQLALAIEQKIELDNLGLGYIEPSLEVVVC
jgi:hypothetical protein